MSALLVMLGVIVAIVALFVALARRRAGAALDQVHHDLPPELKQHLVTLRAAGAKPSMAAASLVARAAAMPASAVGGAVPVPASPSAAAAPAPMRKVSLDAGRGHFMLIYDVGADFVQRRAPFRNEHLALAWKAALAGELLLAGALEEPTEQAFLLFRGSREAAERFAQADPYVRQGLVKQWRVKQWNTVVGEGAAQPMRPAPPASR